MAAATLATLPVVALYLLAQRWFVRGITMSGMGGADGTGPMLDGGAWRRERGRVLMRDTRPNLLFVMSDDHAAHAIGGYGSRINRTPQLDRLAAGGMRLDGCFCTNAICAPSRATILTGTHNHINGVTTLDAKLDGRQVTFPSCSRGPATRPRSSASGTSGTAASTTPPASISGTSCRARAATTTPSSSGRAGGGSIRAT